LGKEGRRSRPAKGRRRGPLSPSGALEGGWGDQVTPAREKGTDPGPATVKREKTTLSHPSQKGGLAGLAPTPGGGGVEGSLPGSLERRKKKGEHNLFSLPHVVKSVIP